MAELGLDFLAITLIVCGIWLLPVGLVVFLYVGFLAIGFGVAGLRHSREAKAHPTPSPRVEHHVHRSVDATRLHSVPEELHLELLGRSLKEGQFNRLIANRRTFRRPPNPRPLRGRP